MKYVAVGYSIVCKGRRLKIRANNDGQGIFECLKSE
jgi:hypothetical protein